jgi:hypothetical protein
MLGPLLRKPITMFQYALDDAGLTDGFDSEPSVPD